MTLYQLYHNYWCCCIPLQQTIKYLMKIIQRILRSWLSCGYMYLGAHLRPINGRAKLCCAPSYIDKYIYIIMFQRIT